MKRLTAVAGLILLLAGCGDATSASVPASTVPDFSGNARVTSCYVLEPGNVRARGSVTNRDTATLTFYLVIEVRDRAGTPLGKDYTWTEPVPPGAQARWEEELTVRDDTVDPTCVLISASSS